VVVTACSSKKEHSAPQHIDGTTSRRRLSKTVISIASDPTKLSCSSRMRTLPKFADRAMTSPSPARFDLAHEGSKSYQASVAVVEKVSRRDPRVADE